MTKDEALKMAIEEIEGWIDYAYGHTPEECADNKTIMACKKALEQPTQEPVLYIDGGGLDGHAICCQDTDIALYTHPKERQGLSDEEIWDIANFLGKNKEWDYPVMFAKTIDKALREKNT